MSEQTQETDAPRVVVVGAGMAGVQTAVALREQGFAGTVTVIGAETHQPYDRPPLSKAVLLGKSDGSAFDIDFPGLGIDLVLGREALAVRPSEHVVDTDAGAVPYDVLVLATGAEPILLPGTEGVPGVHLLRTLDDVERLRPVLADQHDVVVVGAGWIGAEFATAAREAGCAVTVVEAADRPLAGALPADVAAPMASWYADLGVELRTHARVRSVEPGAVLLDDGTRIPAGAVLVGIGARPATAWLRSSGVNLGAHGEVVTDEHLRTSAPDVYAVGDCASFPSARYDERLLIHHWDNALQGPRTVASNILASATGAPPVAYDPVPYFWSEQFGRFVQYAGHHAGADTMIWRGEPSGPAWSVCWLREGRLVALLAVGRPRDLAQGRRLIGAGAVMDAGVLGDAGLPLKSAVA
ncbi:NAD(P)/FAD-dependent oxidoreductase [Streptomyces acidiscabies]|uniref:FAD-dependent oxidoreductase n=3 Tax=Streptomyces acidiscabies TaxID=42234 RepID=A0AAP6B5P1_9ACTN|nr:FAD-dependent oxidoreductase [Streptomyces acidiscabies]MBP5940192.1 oxidoreductase [Streptomyces sp. LBUM 1476]MBZ3911406.1 oxidoreductase [Streptomyces acidiscabies]MDX2958631.1 FAD-dependent oxidoreductase [Streptomyces acidiscabies]MDX3018069.1 FAD-dependent oxidoreductase [Streptomyces acidiscabies]MDX3791466.1 FAD-dependent oxidoreductase [Streptomyces acidiscabies]